MGGIFFFVLLLGSMLCEWVFPDLVRWSGVQVAVWLQNQYSEFPLNSPAAGNTNNALDYYNKLMSSEPVVLAEALGPDPRAVSFIVVVALSSWESRPAVLQILTQLFVAQLLRWALGLVFMAPRPFWVSQNVQVLHCAVTFGFPSGHGLIYTCLILWVSSRYPYIFIKLIAWGWFAAMCVGRLYLGTHDFFDLFCGFCLGHVLFSMLDIHVIVYIARWMGNVYRYLKAPFVSLLIASLCAGVFVFATFEAAPMNPEWMKNALRNPSCPPPDPYRPNDGWEAVAGMAGIFIALLFLPLIDYEEESSPVQGPDFILQLLLILSTVSLITSSDVGMRMLARCIATSSLLWACTPRELWKLGQVTLVHSVYGSV